MKRSLHSIAAGKTTKLSFISMLLSFVSGGATTSKFLTTAAITIRIIASAKFWPPHILVPVPNGIICWAMLKSSAAFVDVFSHRSGRNVSGEGKTVASRCIDQACVETIVPGGTAYPIRSKTSSESPFFEVDAGTTRSRRLGTDEYRRSPSLINAFRYGNSCRTEREGIVPISVMASSSSACSFFIISARRLSSQKKYDSDVDVVSEPAIRWPMHSEMMSRSGMSPSVEE